MFDKFRGRNYQHLNTVEISLKNLVNNYFYLCSLNPKIKVAPSLKSNAYGHDIRLIAKSLDRIRPPFYCVDSLYEAYELERAKVKTKILILGYVHPKSLQTKRLPFWFAVSDMQQIKTLKRYQPQAPIHLFVDTGMHREGFPLKDLPEALSYIKDNNLTLYGLMSHFGASDQPENKLTKQQVTSFHRAYNIVKEAGFNPRWVDIANSSGLLNQDKYKNIGNVARIGIALYGIDPGNRNKNLKPILQLKSTLAHIKQLKKGEAVGYDFTFVAPNDMTVGVLPIGYHDGVDRRLSNIGYVKIGKTFCKILGRVSMNITVIDLSNVADPQIGQEVIVYSNRTRDKNSIINAAKLCKTIPYELLVHIEPVTKRFVID